MIHDIGCKLFIIFRFISLPGKKYQILSSHHVSYYCGLLLLSFQQDVSHKYEVYNLTTPKLSIWFPRFKKIQIYGRRNSIGISSNTYIFQNSYDPMIDFWFASNAIKHIFNNSIRTYIIAI